MNCRLHFPTIRRVSPTSCWIVGAMNFDHFSVPIFHYLRAHDKVSISQTHFSFWRKSIELLWRILAEIVALDVEHARERYFSSSSARVFWIVDCVYLLHFAFRIVINDHLQRTQHCHNSRYTLVKIFAEKVFEHRQLDGAVGLRHTNRVAEIPQRFRRVTAAAHARQRGHAGIVPSADAAVVHELQKLALAEERVGQVETIKFDLL